MVIFYLFKDKNGNIYYISKMLNLMLYQRDSLSLIKAISKRHKQYHHFCVTSKLS